MTDAARLLRLPPTLAEAALRRAGLDPEPPPGDAAIAALAARLAAARAAALDRLARLDAELF